MRDEIVTSSGPTAAEPLTRAPAGDWADAERRLAAGGTYWLATARPDGRPHVRPVLAVWLDGRLYFCSGESTRKARNLAHDSRCVLSVACAGMDLVVEGTAARVTAEDELRPVAARYGSKYDWHVTVRRGVFDGAEGAPTAGPPPYQVYALAPGVVHGFATDDTLASTRWRF